LQIFAFNYVISSYEKFTIEKHSNPNLKYSNTLPATPPDDTLTFNPATTKPGHKGKRKTLQFPGLQRTGGR
jgi:hypothetical protein